MISVGIVGYGFMGKMHAQCYQALPNVKVTAVADAEADRRDQAKTTLQCKTYESIYDMLASADIDAVDVCMPTFLHEEHVIASARAGKNVLCEKPMALTVESCDRMIDAVQQAGVRIMVGHVMRFWPEYRKIKEIVDSDRYGKVRWLSARRLSPRPAWAWQNWLADKSKSGGVILDLQIHDLDYIVSLVGLPENVQAQGASGRDSGLESVMALGWGHEGGATSYVEGVLDLPASFPFCMALLVACEAATIRYDSNAEPSLMVYPLEGEAFPLELPTHGVDAEETGGNIASLGGYYNEIEYFVNCLQTGKPFEVVTPESAREAVRLCLAVRKSVETGKAVSLR